MDLAADIDTLARLPKLTGNQSLVHGPACSTRPSFAAEAKKLGLVERGRHEDLNVVLELARDIARR